VTPQKLEVGISSGADGLKVRRPAFVVLIPAGWSGKLMEKLIRR
jgi:hypothetical protein